MKKIFVLFTVLLFSGLQVFAQDFNTCKTYYTDQKYHTAAECFNSLVMADRNNVQARFWYAASLFFDRQYEKSYNEYRYIANKFPNSEIGRYSRAEAQKVYKKVVYVKKAKANDTGNYIKELDYHSKWYKMPVKVWIEESPYKQTAQKAFSEWQTESNYLVNFTYVSSPKQAQIKLYFVDKINKALSDQNIGLTHLNYIGNMNLKATIQILQRTDSNQMRSYAQMYPVILHEIGHALGMSGHSQRNNDIMYENNYTNDTHLSNRDINTLRAIYKK